MVLISKIKRVKTYGELVMFSHTIFSLPFAIIAMLWAAHGLPSTEVLFWSFIALMAGRNGANAVNRLVDKEIDGKNPRTKNRHLPKGLVKDHEVIFIILLCLALMTLAAYRLNPLCLKLLPLALLGFGIYSYTKRYTWACHIILGMVCGGAPVGAWMAVTGEIGWPSIVLGAIVTCWVGGFDIVYATQDIDFDRNYGLYSIPARFGLKYSLYIAAVLHTITVLLLVYLYFLMNLGWIYLMGVTIVSFLLFLEHSMVSPSSLKTMKIASYSINQVISMTMLLFTVLDFVKFH